MSAWCSSKIETERRIELAFISSGNCCGDLPACGKLCPFMPRQLTLSFDSEAQHRLAKQKQHAIEQPPSVEDIAESLRPRILEVLAEANREVGLRELQTMLGYEAEYGEIAPLRNPVNRILKEMRDAGEVVCREFERGAPLYSVAKDETEKDRATREDVPPGTDSTADDSARESSSREGMDSLAHHHRPLPLVRPDRQFTFDGLPHYEWPPPTHDRDSITVDRIRDDIDGPSHRFLIQRGDSVEAWFSKDKTEVGEVVGISQAWQEVRVSFREGTAGIWFSVGCIYPAVEERQKAAQTSKVIAAADEPSDAFDEADRVQFEPYSLNAFREYRERFEAGESSLAEHRREFARVRATRDAFIDDLKRRSNADGLKALAARFGCFDAKRNTKQKNAEYIFRVILSSFVLSGSVCYNLLTESLEQAVVRKVESISEDDWQRYFAEHAKQQQDEEKALTNPETLDEFRLFVREKGREALDDDQSARFDQLLADQSRASREAKRSSETVAQIESAVNFDLSIKEGWHDKRQCQLWIVQISKRVDRDTFNELNRKAKMLGGWYSSFRKSDAGFQFLTEEHAQRFAGLLDEDADRSDVLADRKARKMDSAAQRLQQVAETLDAEAAEILSSDETRLQNTVRRAEMAAGMRGRAYANQAMAGTVRSIVAALDCGDARYLDGVRARTHVETLIRLLHRAKRDRNSKVLKEYERNPENMSPWDRHRKFEQLDTRPCLPEDVPFASYPYPDIYKRHLEELLVRVEQRRGFKKLAAQMRRFLITDRDYASFVDDGDVALLSEFVQRCKEAGQETRWVDSGMEDYKRLRAANIFTPQELRSALRELLPHLRRKREDDPVRKAEQQLIGRDIPGFFPTPKPIIARMLELAEIEPGQRVLEPSAGKGDILDLLRDQHPDSEITAIEVNSILHEVLSAKGHTVQQGDFLDHGGQYDRVIQNPPFESGADIDHVRHAYGQLVPGGCLVSVMSAGPFFRSDRKATEFREWLLQLDHEVEDLPDDAFRGHDAFRQTGVRTKLVTISKPE